MGVMTKTTGNLQNETAPAKQTANAGKACGQGYYLMSFLVPFGTVTIMYLLGNSPITDGKVIPCCLVSGLLAGVSGFLLYKGCKVIKHAIRPH